MAVKGNLPRKKYKLVLKKKHPAELFAENSIERGSKKQSSVKPPTENLKSRLKKQRRAEPPTEESDSSLDEVNLNEDSDVPVELIGKENPGTENATCLVCNGLYTESQKGEQWIQCQKCELCLTLNVLVLRETFIYTIFVCKIQQFVLKIDIFHLAHICTSFFYIHYYGPFQKF